MKKNSKNLISSTFGHTLTERELVRLGCGHQEIRLHSRLARRHEKNTNLSDLAILNSDARDLLYPSVKTWQFRRNMKQVVLTLFLLTFGLPQASAQCIRAFSKEARFQLIFPKRGFTVSDSNGFLGPQVLRINRRGKDRILEDPGELWELLENAKPEFAVDLLLFLVESQLVKNQRGHSLNSRRRGEYAYFLTRIRKELENPNLVKIQTWEMQFKINLLKLFGSNLYTVSISTRDGSMSYRRSYNEELSVSLSFTSYSGRLVLRLRNGPKPRRAPKRPKSPPPEEEFETVVESLGSRIAFRKGVRLNWFIAFTNYLAKFPHGNLRSRDIEIALEGLELKDFRFLGEPEMRSSREELLPQTVGNPLGLPRSRADVFSLGSILYRIVTGRNVIEDSKIPDFFGVTKEMSWVERMEYLPITYPGSVSEHGVYRVAVRAMKSQNYTIEEFEKDMFSLLRDEGE